MSRVDPSGLAGCKWVGVALICDFGSPPIYDPRTDTFNPQDTYKRPRFPDWSDGEENSDGEPWPKDDKNYCIRQYNHCRNKGWSGECDMCMRQCIASGDGSWPFETCTPPKGPKGKRKKIGFFGGPKGDFCE